MRNRRSIFYGHGKLFRLTLRVLALAVPFSTAHLLRAQWPAAPQPQVEAVKAQLEDAHRLIDVGDFKQAATVLKSFLKIEQGSAAAHEMLAYSYLRLDDPKESLREYTRAAAIERPSSVDLQNVAKDYVLLGDTSDAEHWIRISLQINDRDPESWYILGRIRYTLQRFQEAAGCFQRSLVLLPRSVKAENNLGLAYEGLNRVDDAITAYRQAIFWQQNAEHPSEQPLLNLSIIFLHQGKLKETQGLLTEAVAIAPHDARIHEQLGHLYLQQNMFAAAQEQLEVAITLEPKKPALHFLLGKVYHQDGQEQKAKSEFALSASLSGYHSTPEKF
jgi:Tfp pilus assembly protein PilF